MARSCQNCITFRKQHFLFLLCTGKPEPWNVQKVPIFITSDSVNVEVHYQKVTKVYSEDTIKGKSAIVS